MAEKKSFALRIDAGTMKAIEKWAADEFRSVNGQIEWILDRALREAGRIRSRPDPASPEPPLPEPPLSKPKPPEPKPPR